MKSRCRDAGPRNTSDARRRVRRRIRSVRIFAQIDAIVHMRRKAATSCIAPPRVARSLLAFSRAADRDDLGMRGGIVPCRSTSLHASASTAPSRTRTQPIGLVPARASPPVRSAHRAAHPIGYQVRCISVRAGDPRHHRLRTRHQACDTEAITLRPAPNDARAAHVRAHLSL